jgi:hypothetical protein
MMMSSVLLLQWSCWVANGEGEDRSQVTRQRGRFAADWTLNWDYFDLPLYSDDVF